MGKNIISLADRMEANGFTKPQISVFMELLEDALIDARRQEAEVKVGTVFDIGFSKTAKKSIVLFVRKSQGLTTRLAFFGKKTTSP